MSVAPHHPEVQRRPEQRTIAPPSESRLTLFQREMLLWEVSHPYNAAHVLRISGPGSVAGLRQAIEDTCREAGIGELSIDRRKQSLRYEPLKSIDIRTVAVGASPESAVASIVNEGMNTPFPDRPHYPIRWTVVPERDGGAHHLILLYHHVASDAHGIEALLGAILPRYLGTTSAVDVRRLKPTSAGLAEWFVGQARQAGVVRSLLRATAMTFRMRQSHQLPDDEAEDSRTQFALRQAAPGLLERLSRACERRGVGINDAFMAAAARAIADETADRHLNGRRRKIAVGTVLSERRRASLDLGDYFGVCLSDMLALLDRPDAGIDEVLEQVVEQTRRQKADRAYAAALSIIRYMNIRYLWPLARIRNHRLSYRRVFPLAAGVSTMFVSAARFGEASRRVLRYYRVCPPGPMAPIVLAPTSFSGELELCLTYRVASQTPATAERILAGVVANLDAIALGD